MLLLMGAALAQGMGVGLAIQDVRSIKLGPPAATILLTATGGNLLTATGGNLLMPY
jgi:hypothetical protein